MEIVHHETVATKIQLSADTVDEITIKQLFQLVYPANYLRLIDGERWLTKDDEWYHGSCSESKVRKATDLDIAVFDVIKCITKAREKRER